MSDAQQRPHPLDREASDVVFGLLERVGISAPKNRSVMRFVVAAGAALIVGVHLTVVGAVAVVFNEPMLVPSIGPTVFLLVFAPTLKVARPRNGVGAHLVAILAGVAGRGLFGLYGAGSALAGGLSLAEMSAAVVAVTLTALVASVLDLTHPPSGATALVVGLGLIEGPWGLAALASGVVLAVASCWVPRPHAPPGFGSAIRTRDATLKPGWRRLLSTKVTGTQATHRSTSDGGCNLTMRSRLEEPLLLPVFTLSGVALPWDAWLAMDWQVVAYRHLDGEDQ